MGAESQRDGWINSASAVIPRAADECPMVAPNAVPSPGGEGQGEGEIILIPYICKRGATNATMLILKHLRCNTSCYIRVCRCYNVGYQ